MTEKRFTTVELAKPTQWGIWYDGAYISTYQICLLLNEYVDVKKENEELKNDYITLKLQDKDRYEYCNELKKENEELKQQMQRLYNYFADWFDDRVPPSDFSEMWDFVKEDEKWD